VAFFCFAFLVKTMSNSSALVKPVFTSSMAGTLATLTVGAGNVGLAVAGTAVAVPGALAIAAVAAVGWVGGQIWEFFSSRRQPALRTINVTAVAVEDDDEDTPFVDCLTSLFDQEISLMQQGIF
jgi:hypothetical protein